MTRPRIRLGLSQNREIGELARDTQDALDELPEFEIISFTEVYAEPLNVAFDHEPEMVFAGRVRLDATPQSVVAHNVRVNFTGTQTGFQIDDIEGLTVGTKYRFDLLAVG